MNLLTRLFGMALVAITPIAASPAAQAKETLIVLANNYDRPDAEAIFAQLRPFYQAMQPGDAIEAIDAATLDVIARVELPDEDIYATHTNLKMKKIAPGFARITSHLSNAGTLAVQPVDGEVPEHLDLPRLLRDLGYRTAGAPAILLVGNPLYHDATMPGASTRDAWPSDAHYALTPAESPFGTAGMEDRLAGLKINWCITQDDFVNGAHESGVHRANAMMIAGYGAQLVTYTPNLTQCFERAAAGDVSGADSFPPLDPDVPVGMVTANDMFAVNPALATVPDEPCVAPTKSVVEQGDLLPPDDDLAGAVERGVVQMPWMTVADSDQEDGDAVEFFVEGYEEEAVEVSLTRDGERIQLPVREGKLMVRATKDGRGGVTVAITLDDGRTLFSRELVVGEVAEIDFSL